MHFDSRSNPRQITKKEKKRGKGKGKHDLSMRCGCFNKLSNPGCTHPPLMFLTSDEKQAVENDVEKPKKSKNRCGLRRFGAGRGPHKKQKRALARSLSGLWSMILDVWDRWIPGSVGRVGSVRHLIHDAHFFVPCAVVSGKGDRDATHSYTQTRRLCTWID